MSEYNYNYKYKYKSQSFELISHGDSKCELNSKSMWISMSTTTGKSVKLTEKVTVILIVKPNQSENQKQNVNVRK